MKRIKQEIYETKLLFRNLPAFPFAILCASLIAMNFLAGKGIVPYPLSEYIQCDAGIIVSWITFLAGDMLVRRFGAKASIKINFAAILIELFAIVLLTIGSIIPWGTTPGVYETTWDSIFHLSIWPLAAGTAAMMIALVLDAVLSRTILLKFKKKRAFKAYAVASYTSTAVGQFVDNLGFGLLFSIWQPWFTNRNAIFLYAFLGMIVELICQIIFSPIGFKICQKWDKNKVGQAYIDKVADAQKMYD